MNTRQQSSIRRYGPVAGASLFTAMVVWPWVLGRVVNVLLGVIIITFVVVDLFA